MEGSLDETLNELMTLEERALLRNSFGRIKLKVRSFFYFLFSIWNFAHWKPKSHQKTPTVIIQFWRAFCFFFSNRQNKKFANPLSVDENDDASPSTEGLNGVEEMLDSYATFKEYLDDISRLVKVYSQRYRGKYDFWWRFLIEINQFNAFFPAFLIKQCRISW